MLDTTKPVSTRDGRAVAIVATDRDVTEGGGYVYPIRAMVDRGDGCFHGWNYMANGQWKSNDACNDMDLVNVSVQ